MLALFKELLQSGRLNGPRLEMHSKKKASLSSPKRSRKQVSKDTIESCDSATLILSPPDVALQVVAKPNDDLDLLKELNVVSTDQGLQYRPNIEKEPKSKKRKSEIKAKEKQLLPTFSERQKELRNMLLKTKLQTPCKFYKKGRCTNSNCGFLHEGPPPLCYNLLKNGICDTPDCIYHHNTKSVGCMFYHITHNCTKGDACKFSHDIISDEEMQNLHRIHDEMEMEKKSTMPVEVATAMLKEDVEIAKETSFENIPSLSSAPIIAENRPNDELQAASDDDMSSSDPFY